MRLQRRWFDKVCNLSDVGCIKIDNACPFPRLLEVTKNLTRVCTRTCCKVQVVWGACRPDRRSGKVVWGD